MSISPLVTDPLSTILGGAPDRLRPFPEASRYADTPTDTLQEGDKTVVYLRRRFVPAPARFAQLREHTFVQGDRLDNVTARYLGDPEQFWQLCDANGVLYPDELEVIGRAIRITLPAEIPEPARA